MDINPSDQFRRIHGVNPSPEMMMHAAQALLVVMGADGEISQPEWDAFEGRANLFGYPAEAIAALKAFDFKAAKLEDYVPAIEQLGFQRNVLHDAIVFARADGVYHEKEKESVNHLAKLLKIDPSVVAALEGIIEAEEALGRARLAILSAR